MNIPASALITLSILAGIGLGATLILMKWNIVLTDENASLNYRIKNLLNK